MPSAFTASSVLAIKTLRKTRNLNSFMFVLFPSHMLKSVNYVVSLLRNEKKNFYSNLDTKIVIDNRTFWKTVKPFLSETVTKRYKINLIKLFLVTTRLLKSSVNIL